MSLQKLKVKLQLLTFPKKYSEFASRANAYLKEVVRDEDYMPTEGGLLNAIGFSLIDYNNFVGYISNPSAKEYIDAHMKGKYGDEMLSKAEEIVEYITTLKCWAYAVFQERFANSTSYELKNYAKSSRLGTMKED